MKHDTTKSFAPQSKVEAYQRIEAILGAGPFVSGTKAVHGAHFLYTLFWSQFRARINEMNDAGWLITSVDLPRSQWIRGVRTAYRLDSKPLRPDGDWYEREHGPRPAHPWKKPFSEKRMSDGDCFVLTPPEPRQ